MHDLYMAEIYEPGTIFLPLIVWVYLHSLLHSELRKKLYSVRCCVMVVQHHSRSSKLAPAESLDAASY